MTSTMYAATVSQFTRMLNNLAGLLEKAEAYAAERKFDVNNLFGARLAPDMLPFSFQIQTATDRTKFVLARLTGQTPPAWPDDEKTFEDLKARIAKALDYVGTFSDADLAETATAPVTVKVRGEDVTMDGQDYLFANGYPNFYFHVTTAYDILRHNGVPVGKRDFVG